MTKIILTKDGAAVVSNGSVFSFDTVKAIIKPGTSQDIEQRIEDAINVLRKSEMTLKQGEI